MKNLTQIITKNQDTNLAILSEEDIVLIEDIQQYKSQVYQEMDELKQETYHECTLIREKTHEECNTLKREHELFLEQEKHSLSLKLQRENYEILEQGLHNLTQNYFNILNDMMTKLNITTINSDQVSTLIKNEILKYIQKKEVTISVNVNSRSAIEDELQDIKYNIIYIINNELNDNECIINDGFSIICTEITNCSLKITQLLNKLITI